MCSRLTRLATCSYKRSYVNLATVDPDDLMSTNGRGLSGLPYLSLVTTNIPVKARTFYLVGTTTHSGLFSGERSRQVCVQIADVIWERAISVIGAVRKCRTLYFHTFRPGVTFSTYVRKNGKHAWISVAVLGMTVD